MKESAAIEVARRANRWFSSIPFETLRETLMSAETYEAALSRLEELGFESPGDLIDPDMELDVGGFEGGGALAGGGGKGHEAWLRFWQEWLEPWEELLFEARGYEEIGEEGEHVLVDARVTAQGRLSGVPAELDVCQLWTIRGGRVVHYAVHPTRELALGALERAPEQDQ